MTNELKLAAKIRAEKNGKAKKVLAAGYVPAVIYGSDMENMNLKIKKHDFERAYEIAGESNLIKLAIAGGEPMKVIIKDIQRSGVKNGIIHADFYKVDMKKKISVEIPLNFTGEAKAVKELGGTLVKNLDAVEVECLPGDIIKEIEVDLTKLETFDDVIKLSDLKMPADIELASQDDLVVASVLKPRAEEEVKEEAPAPAEAAPAKEGEEEKKEGEKKEGKGK
ncbi:MAG: 50S ribosomal protein L25 [Nitrospirota bacterium]|nr:50S ribosomal protein L25 [Nitrospirota bacterium]